MASTNFHERTLQFSRAAGLLALFAASNCAGGQQAAPSRMLTVERVADEREMAAALPRETAWVPFGRGLSFVRTLAAPAASSSRKRSAEICAVDAATGKEQVLISAADLDKVFAQEENQTESEEGEEEGGAKNAFESYAWAPDGHHLLLAAADSLAWYDLDTHSARRLVSGKEGLKNAAISPDGHFVSFIRDHAIWLVDVAGGSARALTPAGTSDVREGEPDWVYQNEFGVKTAYWWSPGSSAIAWFETDDRAVAQYSLRSSTGDTLSIAYPKPGGAIPAIHLFVQSISGGKATQVDLGADTNVYIPRVQWLPDGKHLAIQRLSRNQRSLELLLADSATGTTRSILTETDAYWINVSDEWHFFKNSQRFVWSSERSGYRHLYLYDLSGHQIAQLTQGNWVVTSLVETDEAAGAVYFTATAASPRERQMFRVWLDGSGMARVTQQKGTHEVQADPSGAFFLDSWSTSSTPTRMELLRSDGSAVARLTSEQTPDPSISQMPLPEFFTLKSHMGAEMNAWMMKPPDFDAARKYPVIVYVAGGPGEQIVRDAWGGDTQLWFAMMAQKGYVIFALDNRGAAEGGHIFEEPLHLRFSGSEMADQRDGVQYLHSLPWVDSSRIGICGWGYGGFLALHGLLDRPILYKAGFAGSPITDWHLYDAVFAERYLDDPVRNQDGWLASSPLENAQYFKGPLLIAQATLDERVHLENSLQLLDELLDKRKYADILLFPDRPDLFDDPGARQILFQRITDFFLKNL